MIDEHTRQPIPDRALHKRCGHCGVHPAGQPTDRATVTDLRGDSRDLGVDDTLGRPVGGQTCDVVQEPLQDRLSVVGVCHLRVELHPGQRPVAVHEGRDRSRRCGCHDVTVGRRLHHGITVGHPYRLLLGLTGEEHRLGGLECSPPVLAQARLVDPAAETCRHHLEPVTDPEHRHVGLQQFLVEGGCVVNVHTRRTSGEDDGQRLLREDLLSAPGVRDHLRVQMCLADAARDELGVLGAEVDDEDGTGQVRHAPSLGGGLSPSAPPHAGSPAVGSAEHLSRTGGRSAPPPSPRRRAAGCTARPPPR